MEEEQPQYLTDPGSAALPVPATAPDTAARPVSSAEWRPGSGAESRPPSGPKWGSKHGSGAGVRSGSGSGHESGVQGGAREEEVEPVDVRYEQQQDGNNAGSR